MLWYAVGEDLSSAVQLLPAEVVSLRCGCRLCAVAVGCCGCPCGSCCCCGISGVANGVSHNATFREGSLNDAMRTRKRVGQKTVERRVRESKTQEACQDLVSFFECMGEGN